MVRTQYGTCIKYYVTAHVKIDQARFALVFLATSPRLTEVMWGTVRRVRSLKLNEATSVLSWTYGLSLVKITEKVPLRKAWVRGKLLLLSVE